MTQENQEKLDYIKSLITIEDWNDTEVIMADEYASTIAFDDFDLTDSLPQICKQATKYSCCGMVLDEDHMICETCKEHC